ncbi:hypothetical protein [Streptomyces sp. SAJ15]|uniref:hypothetical protein n=1 Tax=Streptomyces sp. SAJ15 TaxID=2011095 RepID=UPI00135F0E07|nr:hypothetical protein [Streptomyces sp. SAJ15]TVL89809.1 hypothetical protein CD790_25785 [Streptomyces sp. SAJ15]
MATYTSRTVVSTLHEWIVPAPDPRGACLGDLRSALAAAGVAYRVAHGLPDDAPLADDALRFRAHDDEIVISFTTEHDARAAEGSGR